MGFYIIVPLYLRRTVDDGEGEAEEEGVGEEGEKGKKEEKGGEKEEGEKEEEAGEEGEKEEGEEDKTFCMFACQVGKKQKCGQVDEIKKRGRGRL